MPLWQRLLITIATMLVTSFVAALVLTVTAQFGRLSPTRAAIYVICIAVFVFGFQPEKKPQIKTELPPAVVQPEQV